MSGFLILQAANPRQTLSLPLSQFCTHGIKMLVWSFGARYSFNTDCLTDCLDNISLKVILVTVVYNVIHIYIQNVNVKCKQYILF